MRDIVRDAAIITVAKRIMAECEYMDVAAFLSEYSSTEQERNELIDTLTLFNLIWAKCYTDGWGSNHYVWCWITD